MSGHIFVTFNEVVDADDVKVMWSLFLFATTSAYTELPCSVLLRNTIISIYSPYERAPTCLLCAIGIYYYERAPTAALHALDFLVTLTSNREDFLGFVNDRARVFFFIIIVIVVVIFRSLETLRFRVCAERESDRSRRD